MVVISRARNKLYSISSHGILIPVRDPLEGQLAVLALDCQGQYLVLSSLGVE